MGSLAYLGLHSHFGVEIDVAKFKVQEYVSVEVLFWPALQVVLGKVHAHKLLGVIENRDFACEVVVGQVDIAQVGQVGQVIRDGARKRTVLHLQNF